MAENIYIEPELIIYKNDKIYDLSEYIQSMQVTKSLRNPVGAFNIVLNPTITSKGRITLLTHKIYNEINSMLAVNDVIAGKINKRSKRHSFLGLTSQHFESKIQFNNQTSRSIVVNGGFALPKLLMRNTITFAPQIADMPEIKNDPVLKNCVQFFAWQRAIDDEGKSVFNGEPENIVKWILDNAVATNIQIYDGKSVKSLFPGPKDNKKDYSGNDLINFKFLGREMIYGKQLSTFTGSIIDYIYECLDKEFYELFFDTTTGEDGLPYNTIVIRTKPFSHQDILSPNAYFWNWSYWEDLAKQAVTIKGDDCIQTEIGKNDYELKNFFRLYYKKSLDAQVLGQYGVSYPTFNINSIKRHGLRELQVDSTILVGMDDIISDYNKALIAGKWEPLPSLLTAFARENLASSGFNPLNTLPPSAKSAGSAFLRGLLDKRDKIKEWFAFPYYESGTLRTVCNEEVTIGRLINLPEYEYYFPLDGNIYKGIKLYPTEVTHNYSWGQLAETRATVTTGQPDGVVKKWFDHPDNQFSVTPLDKLPIEIEDKTYDKSFWDSLKGLYQKMHTITEIPNG